MALPVFYSAEITGKNDQHIIDEETSRHIVQVLRMKQNESLQISNGKGYMFLARIIDDNKKKVVVNIIEKNFQEQAPRVSIGISLVKNAQRFEWFLEKFLYVK